jgi:DNA-binding response OmpR family regulator
MPKIVIDTATKFRIIELLANNPDGLTREQISHRLGGIEKRTLQYVLDRLPCVYVDRWQQRTVGKPEAVWAVLDKPAKPPKPTIN